MFRILLLSLFFLTVTSAPAEAGVGAASGPALFWAPPTLVVPLSIEGHALPRGCVVDTGSPMTLLSQRVVGSLPLKRLQELSPWQLSGIGGAPLAATAYTGTQIQAGPWSWEHLGFWAVDLNEWTDCLLGRDALAQQGSLTIHWDDPGKGGTPHL